jgi:hypothetical protein
MTDTEPARRTRGRSALLILLGAVALMSWVNASPSPSTRVVLVRESRVYLALADSSSVRVGDRVDFRLRGRELAAGTATRVLGELAVVEISAGSIAKVHKLDRLEVSAQRANLASRARLRLGYPAATRSTLWFACERVDFLPPLPTGAYRLGASSERERRAVRDPSVLVGAPWPDTLVAHFFDDADDEEIALERGDLDVAVFWPGELSRHMREQSRWQGHLWATRSRGIVVARGLAASSTESAVAPDSAALDHFNRELFRGDLARWQSPASSARPFGPIRFEVDLTSPGWREMQRLLDTFAPPTTTRHARLSVLDQPVASLDSLEATGLTPLFLFRCPVVSSAELRPYLTALGPGALVDALDCRMRLHP